MELRLAFSGLTGLKIHKLNNIRYNPFPIKKKNKQLHNLEQTLFLSSHDLFQMRISLHLPLLVIQIYSKKKSTEIANSILRHYSINEYRCLSSL